MVMDEGVVGDSRLGSGLTYWLTRRKISMIKSSIGGERVWFLMGLYTEYLSNSHINLSSDIAIW